MQQIRDTVTVMKNAFDGPISKPYGTEGNKTSELEDISIECLKTENQRTKTEITQQNIQGLWNNYKMCNMCNGNTRKRREKGTKKYLKQ